MIKSALIQGKGCYTLYKDKIGCGPGNMKRNCSAPTILELHKLWTKGTSGSIQLGVVLD